MSTTGTKIVRGTLVVTGLLALAVAVGMLLVPNRLPGVTAMTAGVDLVGANRVATVIAIVLGIAAAVAVRSSADIGSTLLVDTPPERSIPSSTVVGSAFDERTSWTAERIARGEIDAEESQSRRELRETLRGVLRRDGTLSSTAIEDRLESGSWTDDSIAGAFLASDVDYPLRYRIVRWLQPNIAYERAVRRTAEAIAARDPKRPERTARSRHSDGSNRPRKDASQHADRSFGAGSSNEQWDATSTSRRVSRWQPVLAGAIALTAAGIWLRVPTLVLAAAVPVAYVAYSATTNAPELEHTLSIERSMRVDEPLPSERVPIELVVTNAGNEPIADLRIVDGVPDRLPVVEGSPRLATALRAGESATVEYVVAARHGEATFSAVAARTRSTSAASVRTAEIEPTGDTTISCAMTAERWPVHRQTLSTVGSVSSERGGSGVEFHSSRAYRRGDPPNRIDWRRYAKTGSLTTVEYVAERSARVVVVVDARPRSHVARGPDELTGTELAAYAAIRAVDGLIRDRQEVGLATIGMRDADSPHGQDIGFGWVPPGGSTETRIRIVSLLDRIAAGAGGGIGPDRSTVERTEAPDPIRLVERFHPGTQLLLITPGLDDYPVKLARASRAAGRAVTVLSPNVTTIETPGATIAAINRRTIIGELRTAGATVTDWATTEPIETQLPRIR